MTAQLKLINGSVSTPSIAFASDPTTGLYRPSSGVVGVTGDISTTGTVKQNGNALIPIGLGPLQWSGVSAPPLWVFVGQTLSRSTYSALWTFAQNEIANGNNFYGVGDGSTTFSIGDMKGFTPAGVDAAASRISGITHVGDTTGSATHTLALTELPTGITSSSIQTITVSGPTGGNTLVFNQIASSNNAAGGATNYFTGGAQSSSLVFSGLNTIAVTSTNTSGGAHSIVQPIRAFNYIIFAGV